MKQKKLTPKQRAEIYLQVYKSLENGTWKRKQKTPFLCDLIGRKIALSTLYNPKKFGFVEFQLFKPRKIKRLGWWDNYDINSRKNCLLLCYEMALDAKE